MLTNHHMEYVNKMMERRFTEVNKSWTEKGTGYTRTVHFLYWFTRGNIWHSRLKSQDIRWLWDTYSLPFTLLFSWCVNNVSNKSLVFIVRFLTKNIFCTCSSLWLLYISTSSSWLGYVSTGVRDYSESDTSTKTREVVGVRHFP